MDYHETMPVGVYLAGYFLAILTIVAPIATILHGAPTTTPGGTIQGSSIEEPVERS